jgi:hypothetical protein
VFGAQLLAQFIQIASATCPDRDVKSQHAATIAAGTLAAGSVAAQRITISGIRGGHAMLQFRATWYCTIDLDPAWEVRETGLACVGRRRRATGDHAADAHPPWTAWPTFRRHTPPTAPRTLCRTSARQPQGSTPRWTCRGSSRHLDEKHILVNGELRLSEMSLLLTPMRRRCQSCETNTAYVSYANPG